jgi:glycosyltransferase involved in cell wall biosynthesis
LHRMTPKGEREQKEPRAPLNTPVAEGLTPNSGPLVQSKAAELLSDPAAPLVSVIIRSMGRRELGEALDSVAGQTYPAVEVVVVNAKGPDHPPVAPTCGSFPVRVVGTGEPLARSRAANVGLEEARGEFLILLDDDDWFLPGHVPALAATLAAYSEAVAAYAGARAVGPDEAETWGLNRPFSPALLRAGNYIALHAAMFRRHAIEGGVSFDEDLDVYEDWDFFLQLAARGPFVHVDQITACYRSGGASAVGLSGNEQGRRAGRARVFDKWRRRWSGEELAELAEELNSRTLSLEAFQGEFLTKLGEAEREVAELQVRLVQIDRSWTFLLTGPLRRFGSKVKRATQRWLLPPRFVPEAEVPRQAPPVVLTQARKPLISVVMPVYNACRSNPDYLREALESVYAQTYRNLELILVDDGSNDDTRKLCETFIAERPAMAIRYCWKENGGQSSARNYGVAQSRGEWIGFLDQDDRWYADRLARVLPHLKDGVDLVYTDADSIGEDGRLEFVGLHRKFHFGEPHPKRRIEDVLFKDVFVMPGIMTLRRATFEAVGRFDESLSGYEDDDLFVRLFQHASVVYLGESTLMWRFYSHNYSNTLRMVHSRIRYWRKLMERFGRGGAERYVAVGISRRFFREFLRQASLQYHYGNPLYADNLATAGEIVPYLPAWERWLFVHPRKAWCRIAASSLVVGKGLEVLWHLAESQPR